MTRELLASAAAVALLIGDWSPALAQDAGGTTQSPPAAGENLPEVQVIQEQQKAKPKPVTQKKKPQPAAPVAASAPPAAVATPVEANFAEPVESSVVKMSPMGGSEIPVNKVPGSVYQMNSSDLKRDGTVIVQEALQTQIPGVIIGDLQGNQFQTNIQYRGFEASPVNGVAQGLAVYQNGVRINEAFGDIVNWDFLPSNAINNVALVTGNPVFGLNALGGAIVLDMKDGFNYQGVEIDTRFGSFGRKQVSTEAGYRSGNWGIYGAFEAINDDGFRDFSEAEVRRGYFDLGVKGDGAEFHFNFTGADNHVGVTAAAPEQLLDISRRLTFTSPQTSDNEMQMYSLNGKVQATNTLTISGATYYRHFNQKHADGNLFEDPGACEDDASTLCSDGEPVFVFDPANPGQRIAFNPDVGYGSIDQTSQNADGFGISLQATERARLFGHENQFVVGVSYDRGKVAYSAKSELGYMQPKFVVDGTGIILDGEELFPRSLTTTNDYFGAFFADTFNITDKLALTVGGRYNFARIEIENTGDSENDEMEKLNGVNKYNRFNPTAGLTYTFNPGLNWYGGYSEANRAPTPAEIACSDPENPCIIESFLTADPPLKQVVSRTWETGLRGTINNWNGSQWDWGLGLFRTENSDDIMSAASTETGRGYFQNIGTTLRQGVTANIAYRSQRLFAYGNYTYTDATFQSNIPYFPAPNHPDGPGVFPCGDDDDGGGDGDDDEELQCTFVRKGDRLSGIPAHTFKAGFDYWMTPKWKVGADVVAASSQFFFEDQANLSRPLPGYAKVNLHTSYDITENIQIYGLFENLFDKRYSLYGTYFSVDEANDLSDQTGVEFDEDNPRTVVPGMPFAAYGGIKVKF
ncbi:TonB-dependent receptor [Hyphomicrobium sp.]|uniref:TonB-dependent receptor n=1 Tax=Hyphomicrobium sp. TaxID=82 RepID=UPI002D790EEA|nr:TonB-dependent receptor [Hyphomicrobium sp.]HET6387834.1 TonB-dependent receptor [Hyphomicrobium sp.]